MMRNCILFLAIGFSLELTFAEEFRKSYTIPANSQIKIENFLGSVKITGYNGKDIELTAYTKGSESNLIEINDRRIPGGISIFSQFSMPRQFGPPRPPEPPRQFGRPSQQFNPPNSVDFEINIPQSLNYRLWVRSGWGNIEVINVRGWLEATSITGNVRVSVEDPKDKSYLNLYSHSGNIDVRAPADLEADVQMESHWGMVKTNFPIEVKDVRYGQGKSAIGKLGSGDLDLRANSGSGQVSLLHN
jgi:hypothetical protein